MNLSGQGCRMSSLPVPGALRTPEPCRFVLGAGTANFERGWSYSRSRCTLATGPGRFKKPFTGLAEFVRFIIIRPGQAVLGHGKKTARCA